MVGTFQIFSFMLSLNFNHSEGLWNLIGRSIRLKSLIPNLLVERCNAILTLQFWKGLTMNTFLANIIFLHFLLVYAAPFKMAIPNIPYARHYKPRLVYFLPHFQRPFLCFKGGFFKKFCPYVWLVFKSVF